MDRQLGRLNQIPRGGDVWQSDPLTDRQRQFAEELGLTLPADCTKGEASRLIGLALHGPAHPVYVQIADHYAATREGEWCRDEVVDDIMRALRQRGRERELAEWYAYRVYRHLVDHDEGAPEHLPWSAALQATVDDICTDPRISEDLTKAAAGANFLRFGDSHAASTRSRLFRFTKERIVHLVPSPERSPPSVRPRSVFNAQPSGFSEWERKLKLDRKATRPAVQNSRMEIPAAWLQPEATPAPAVDRARRAVAEHRHRQEVKKGLILAGVIIALLMLTAILN